MTPMRSRRVRRAGADVLLLARLGDPPRGMDVFRIGVQRQSYRRVARRLAQRSRSVVGHDRRRMQFPAAPAQHQVLPITREFAGVDGNSHASTAPLGPTQKVLFELARGCVMSEPTTDHHRFVDSVAKFH